MRRWQPGLVALLTGLSLAKELDVLLAGAAARALVGTPFYKLYYWGGMGLQVGMLVVAGVLVDRFGVRIVVAVALALWALGAAATGVVASPVAVAILRSLDLLALMAFAAAAALPVATAVPPERRARVLGGLNLMAVLWLVGVPRLSFGWPHGGPSIAGWSSGFLVAAAIGVALAALWWRGTRAAATAMAPVRDGVSWREFVALLRRPGAVALILVLCCYTQAVFAAERLVLVHLTNERLLAAPMVLRLVAPALALFVIAQVVVSVWADRRIARLGHPGRARAPFVVAGGVLASAVGVVPVLGLGGVGVALAVTGLGMALFSMIFVLALDVVPRDLLGRFFGVALAATVASLAFGFLAGPFVGALFGLALNALDIYFYDAAAASMLGAVLAAMILPELRSLGADAAPTRIGAVFA